MLTFSQLFILKNCEQREQLSIEKDFFSDNPTQPIGQQHKTLWISSNSISKEHLKRRTLLCEEIKQ